MIEVMKKMSVLLFSLMLLFVAGFNLIESKSSIEYSDLLFDDIEAAAICEISGGGPTTKCNPESGKKCYIGELVAENCFSYIARWIKNGYV